MPPVGTPLTSEVMLDISHESLLRQWNRLQKWIAQESESATNYQRLVDAVRSQEDALEGLRLDRALRWRDNQRPTPAWAMNTTAQRSLMTACSHDAWP